jgi:uncharacterized NAD(P)/FAD-binding protein YdhS
MGTVAVIGAGAAGTLTAVRLLREATGPLHVLLVDPDLATGRGVAYSTPDTRHLLNVPASGMSAFAEEPDHLVRWLRGSVAPEAQPQDFVPRAWYGAYLATLLARAVGTGDGRLTRIHDRVTRLEEHGTALLLGTESGETHQADAAVIAVGTRPAAAWAPAALRGSARFVTDPWLPGALTELPKGDVLLVGTGLTMVDIAISADEDRTLHAVSRHGVLPRTHRLPTTPPVDPPSGLLHCTDLPSLRRLVEDHVAETVEVTGDWRAAVDGLRGVTTAVWQRLPEADKRAFLVDDARTWDALRHRMSPWTRSRLDAVTEAGRFHQHTGSVSDAVEDEDGLTVTLTDGTELRVGAVVNCTGPVADLASNPLLAALHAAGAVAPGPAGLGLATGPGGRVRSPGARDRSEDRPLWTLGALRRGDLWESTAMPEIRVQAAEVARAVLAHLGDLTASRTPTVGAAVDAGAHGHHGRAADAGAAEPRPGGGTGAGTPPGTSLPH